MENHDKINQEDQTVKEEEENLSENNQEESMVDMNSFHHLANQIITAILKCLGFDHFFSTKQPINQDSKDSSCGSCDFVSDPHKNERVVEGEEELVAMTLTGRRRRRQAAPPLDGGGNPQTNSNSNI